MAEPQTVNGGLIVPNTGDLVGTWGSAALNPDFVAVDGFLCGVQTVSLSNINVTLTSPAAFTPTPGGGPTQAQNAVIRLTGTLSGNIVITLPLPGYMIIENLTTAGGNIVQFRAIGSGEIICIDQGEVQHVYNDGTNVRFVNLPPVGTYLDLAVSSVPAWITNCTKPPYLNCDGSTFSAVTYPYLNNKLGGNTLPDSRGSFRLALNQGTNRVTTGNGGVDGNTLIARGGVPSQVLVTNNLPPYTPSGNLSITAHVPISPQSLSVTAGGTGIEEPIGSTPVVFDTATFVGNPQGGISASFNVVPPAYTGGITLIRAA